MTLSSACNKTISSNYLTKIRKNTGSNLSITMSVRIASPRSRGSVVVAAVAVAAVAPVEKEASMEPATMKTTVKGDSFTRSGHEVFENIHVDPPFDSCSSK